MSKSGTAPSKMWLDGKLIDYKDGSVPILTHSLQYGSGIFEGMRAYSTEKGLAIFRLRDHMKRFLNSAKVYSIDLRHTQESLEKASLEVVKANGFKSCYIRPFAFYNDAQIGISAVGKKVSVAIICVPFEHYFGSKIETGIKCKISSWHRINSEILPVQAKASGNYLNSIIANQEAKKAGYDEAILMGSNGYIAEGPGENIFLVKEGRLITPGPESDILMGITRDSIIKLAELSDIEVSERFVHKEELYTANEVFFTGTAAELTPIINIDGIQIGTGRPGPITKMLASKYSDAVGGKSKPLRDWLTFVK
jgi:branched-chain amino acid aminotransferase